MYLSKINKNSLKFIFDLKIPWSWLEVMSVKIA